MKKTATSPNCVSAIAQRLIPGLRKRRLGGAFSPFIALWNSSPAVICIIDCSHKPLCRMGLTGILITSHIFLIKVGRTCIGSQAHAMLNNVESITLLPSPVAALAAALFLNCCKAHCPHQKLWDFTLVFSLVVCEWIAYTEAFPAVSNGHFYSCAFDSELCGVAELVEIE